MPVSDYLKIGAAGFLSRLGGGGGVNVPAMVQGMKRDRAEQEYLGMGGDLENGPNVSTMTGMTPPSAGGMAMNVPTTKRLDPLEAQKKLAQAYINQGMVTQGLGMMADVEKQKADMAAAQAEAQAKMAKAQQEKLKTTMQAINMDPRFGAMVGRQMGMDIDLKDYEFNVSGPGQNVKINGMPFVIVRSMQGTKILPLEISQSASALMGLGGNFGANQLDLVNKYTMGDLKFEEMQKGMAAAVLKDQEFAKEPSSFEKSIKLEELSLKRQNTASMIATRSARAKAAIRSVGSVNSMRDLERMQRMVDRDLRIRINKSKLADIGTRAQLEEAKRLTKKSSALSKEIFDLQKSILKMESGEASRFFPEMKDVKAEIDLSKQFLRDKQNEFNSLENKINQIYSGSETSPETAPTKTETDDSSETIYDINELDEE